MWECEVVYDYQAETEQSISVYAGQHVWGVVESGDWTQIRTEDGRVGMDSLSNLQDGFVPTSFLERVLPLQIHRVVALYDYQSNEPDKLSLLAGEVLEIWSECNGWYNGRNAAGDTGWFPASFVNVM